MINGQKVWTSLAQYSDRCVLLTRTGPADSRHRGITAFFVDMDTPGITVVPLEMINGVLEFAEVYFDDVVVPADRMLGDAERRVVRGHVDPPVRTVVVLLGNASRTSTAACSCSSRPRPTTTGPRTWSATRSCSCTRCGRGRARRSTDSRRARRSARRRRSTRSSSRPRSRRPTTRRGACCPASIEIDDGVAGEMWRSEFLYSRAATIYGGTAEVQRNIIARRLLDLGADD